MAASDKPITPDEAAQLHAAMHEAAIHGAMHEPGAAPFGQRPDFIQKAVDFVTMVDDSGLLERFAEELDALAAEDGADDAEAHAE